ncbi:MAG: peptide chain release factor N(5)-glutamine methyltransferase [Acidobacteriia bacterium]|nr:peptide chain release factor N(5)-glutamine methyltransferase [Terriglobia bacterium]
MNIRAALKEGLARLREAHTPSFTLAAELLLLHVIGRDRAWLYAHPEDELFPEDAARYRQLLARRAAGEPTQHLTGKQEFWGLEFEVTPDVLIPRPETEHLIEIALDRLAVRELRAGRQQKTQGEGLRIADVGTGSGCIAIALAHELPAATIFATDTSPAALAVARRNAQHHNVSDRIHFIECNLLDALPVGARHAVPRTAVGAVPLQPSGASHESPLLDLIVSNPPYIGQREAASLPREVRDHEPASALFGGEEGYELCAALVTEAAARLAPGGLLVLELGHDSLPAVRPLFDTPAWTSVAVTNDLAGIPRVIAAEHQ